ncbi:peptidase domain-containing ABC transporter [Spirulina sp. CS-785/01]|uniref:peptidase domain-containing ABC transporter n=1 Tax=Spirulina sp. CS-785/01 TaxID=3021716 RepID=UPI00232F6932|nr:peptidase domain-containing ABC transporter [Spirulina sp. CS-785/01]MDB9311586.1 peptidase domain-containing ABC transporter [Spirulina sp. CS-785/01]
MSYTTPDLRVFLEKQIPFNALPSDAIATVVKNLKPLRYRMGQTILLKDRLPQQIAILWEGNVRVLGYDAATQMPMTLELAESGSILGWVGVLRGVACETAIASTETICLTLDANLFLSLIQDHPRFAQYFQQNVTLAELFDILSQQDFLQVQSITDLKTLTKQAQDQSRLCILPPGRHPLGDNLTQPLQQPGWIWFVSGGGSLEGLTAGNILELPDTQQQLQVKGNFPVRLVGVRQEALNITPVPPPETPTETPQPPSSGFADAPDDDEAIPYASQPIAAADNLPSHQPPQKPSKQPQYPYIRAGGGVEGIVACLQMLSQYYKAPFRREVVRRVLNDQLQRQGSLSLYHIGAVTELIGLNSQIVSIPARTLTRLQPPVLLRWQESYAILYEISDRQLVIAVPEVGILRRKPADFLDTWEKVGQVLLVQPTKETPQERFGLSWFIPALLQYKWILVEVFIASFLVQLFGLANPLIIQIIIDKVIVQNSADTLGILGVFLVAVAIFEAILSTARTYLFVDTTNRIDMKLGSEIIDHLLRLPLRYFDRRPVGELSSRVNELENIRSFLTGTALTVVLDSIFSVVYIAVMLIYSWRLTLLALATIPVFLITTAFFSPLIRRQLRRKAEQNAQTQSHLVEVMSGIQTVKAQNIELRSRWRWQDLYSRYVSSGFKTVQTSTLANSSSNFLNKLSGLLVLWGGAYLVLQGELTLGQLIAFRIIASYVTSPLLRLAQLWQNFQEVALSLERLGDIIDTPQEAEEDVGNIPMPPIEGGVKYENVSFRFKPNGPLQLVNVNAEIPAGNFVGIVGKSGAGKSTLTKLLVRLYDVESGRILIDGYDVSKVELYSLRRQIGVVPQDPLLFEGTVQENIAMNNPEASSEEVIEAAKIAAAHEFIMELPSGYNTRVGERGASLSGGQRQRIAIARTILQRPALLVLDEATSALDYLTEQQVCANLHGEFGDRTVFFITHRLATIKNSDIIIMMDAGAAVEQGSHEELMALQGRYYALYKQQELRA